MIESRTVIIADSLTNDFLSPESVFTNTKVHAGLPEVRRLMGRGMEYGRGPLPSFLNEAMKSKEGGEPIDFIFLRDLHDESDSKQQAELLRFGRHNIAGTEGAEFLPFIEPLTVHSEVIDTQTLALPLQEFHQSMKRILGGQDILDLSDEEKARIQFILVGVYSNIRILGTATSLRNQYEFPNVSVSPHLMGSPDQWGHTHALLSEYPNALVTVEPDLKHLAEIARIRSSIHNVGLYRSCALGPEELAGTFDRDQQSVLENLFLFQDRVELKRLGGGYSGSLLFLAQPERDQARGDPSIVKVDRYAQMQKEIAGYHLVKDLLGKHVPTFGIPVTRGEQTGVKMELASMQGAPRTMQSMLEHIGTQKELDDFLTVFRSALEILTEQLYQNTKQNRLIHPYRMYGLHRGEKQKKWLAANIERIIPGANSKSNFLQLKPGLWIRNQYENFSRIIQHIDRVPVDIALGHGDLNLQNLITDAQGNMWAIDWTHAGEYPIEMDYAKMENDIKFVALKSFTEEDLPRLAVLEEFLLRSVQLPPPSTLEQDYPEFTSDLRFKTLYESVRQIRTQYADIRTHENDALYRIALLHHGVFTLSFDKRTGKGECELPQLKYALVSVMKLISLLASDPMHQQTKKERPDSYPQRSVVPAGVHEWSADLSDYHPVSFTHPSVLSSPGADSEDVSQIDFSQRTSCAGPLRLDAEGHPLHPNGPTGMTGRGELFLWGPNDAVDVVDIVLNPVSGELEIILVKRKDADEWSLPGVFLLPEETMEDAVKRIYETKIGLDSPRDFQSLQASVMNDFRQTDNAWVESKPVLIERASHERRKPKDALHQNTVDIAFVPLTQKGISELFASHAVHIQRTLEHLANHSGTPRIREAAARFLSTLS